MLLKKLLFFCVCVHGCVFLRVLVGEFLCVREGVGEWMGVCTGVVGRWVWYI